MISLKFLAPISFLLLALPAFAADIAPAYQVPRGHVGGTVILCPSSDGSNTAVVCTFSGSGGSGGSVTDTNSASYTSWPTITPNGGVYTPPTGTRKLVANTTSPGNVVLTDGSGNTWTIALSTGSTEINAVPASFTTTATATFLAVK